jgi:hypothetical protein
MEKLPESLCGTTYVHTYVHSLTGPVGLCTYVVPNFIKKNPEPTSMKLRYRFLPALI